MDYGPVGTEKDPHERWASLPPGFTVVRRRSSLLAAFSWDPRPNSALHCPSRNCPLGPTIWRAGLLVGPHSCIPTCLSGPACKHTFSKEASFQLQPVSAFFSCELGKGSSSPEFLSVLGCLSEQGLYKNVCVHMCEGESCRWR